MPRNETMTDERVREIRRKVVTEKRSVQEVCDEEQLPYFTVYQIVRGWTYPKVGGPTLKRQRYRLTPERAAKMRALKEKGATIDQIAKAAQCGTTTVKKALAGGM
ncbi:MAG: helix-turn-helix domain-containing protein [bacterium]